MLPFRSVAATAAVPRPLPREFRREFRREFPRVSEIVGELVSGLRQPIYQAAAVVRRRRFGFYLDVMGAALVMALFVAAAILV